MVAVGGRGGGAEVGNIFITSIIQHIQYDILT